MEQFNWGTETFTCKLFKIFNRTYTQSWVKKNKNNITALRSDSVKIIPYFIYLLRLISIEGADFLSKTAATLFAVGNLAL